MPRVNRNARINIPAYSGRNDYERHKLESDNEVNKSHYLLLHVVPVGVSYIVCRLMGKKTVFHLLVVFPQ